PGVILFIRRAQHGSKSRVGGRRCYNGRMTEEAADEPADGTTLRLRGEHITLAQALKAAGLADSGGQAKDPARGRRVNVNGRAAPVRGAAATQPGGRHHAGDRFRVADGPEWTVQR